MDGSIRYMNTICYRKDITDACEIRILRIRSSAHINSIQLISNNSTLWSIQLAHLEGLSVDSLCCVPEKDTLSAAQYRCNPDRLEIVL